MSMRRNALHKLAPLLRRPSFTAADARARGVSASQLAYYVKKGDIERISHGVYAGHESMRKEVPFEWEDLVATVQSVSTGVVCLISALALYELTDEIPRQFWIAVPNKQFPPRRKGARIVRMRDMSTGRTRLKLGEVSISIFDKERTIVDAFRYLPSEVALKALKEYLSGSAGRPDLVKLMKYSKKLRTPIRSYVEAFTI